MPAWNRVTGRRYVAQMTKKQRTLIAGEPLELLSQRIPGLEVFPLAGSMVHISFPIDTEQGAAWMRAIERYAADLLTAAQPLSVLARRDAAAVRIAEEMAEAKRQRGG